MSANAKRAGLADSPVALPLDSFRDAAQHLRRPFTPAAVKFKVQATWPKDTPSGGLIVSYIDARLAVERLNLIVPHLWRDEYEPTAKGLMWCHLTVDGITRSDIGEGQGKGLVSDALKRAAVKFGVGVSLYAVPKMMLNASDGHLKQKRSREGLTLELTPAGEKFVRSTYSNWLEAHGIQAFGEPLDHGDTEGAQGDAEVEVDPATGEVLDNTSVIPGPPAALVAELTAAKAAAGVDTEWMRSHLVGVGAQDVPDGDVTLATIKALSFEQASQLLDELTDEALKRKAAA